VHLYQVSLLVYNAVFVINNAFRNWGHQFLYDRTLLKSMLEEVGFSDITFVAPGESEDKHLRGIETHGQKSSAKCSILERGYYALISCGNGAKR
jgi:hypothetical protein